MKIHLAGIIPIRGKKPLPACGVYKNRSSFKNSHNLSEVTCKKCLRRKEWVLYCIREHLDENLKVFEEIYQ